MELWLPLALDPARTNPASFNLVGIGRLKRGASPEAARADLERVLPGIRDYLPADISPATWDQAHPVPQDDRRTEAWPPLTGSVCKHGLCG